jgi:hypothetical protein
VANNLGIGYLLTAINWRGAVMPIVKILPIEFRTENGNQGSITGINPSSIDPLVGHVSLVTGETYEGKWDLRGQARDNDGSMNIKTREMDEDEWRDLVEYAKSQLTPSVLQVLPNP